MSGGPIQERNQDATVYVGGLDEKVTENLLWELFLQSGPVVNVHMPRDRITQQHQSYGFIEFMGEEDADYAIKIMNMIKLYGKPIRVNKAASNTKNLDVGANLFIGNLDTEIDEKLLYDIFSAFGVILQTPKIMRDPDSGNSKGFAFVNYASFDSSDAALDAMNGQHLCNRAISVSYAFKKDSKGERHGSAAERMLAAQNPLTQIDRPHQLFADAPPIQLVPQIAPPMAPPFMGAMPMGMAPPPLMPPHMQAMPPPMQHPPMHPPSLMPGHPPNHPMQPPFGPPPGMHGPPPPGPFQAQPRPPPHHPVPPPPPRALLSTPQGPPQQGQRPPHPPPPQQPPQQQQQQFRPPPPPMGMQPGQPGPPRAGGFPPPPPGFRPPPPAPNMNAPRPAGAPPPPPPLMGMQPPSRPPPPPMGGQRAPLLGTAPPPPQAPPPHAQPQQM